MSHTHKSENPNRSIHSNRLLQQLLLGGRDLCCEVLGCGCTDPVELEIHHIMPVTVDPVHETYNLAILCRDHHALVEKFYWWERSQLMPAEAREARQIAIKFHFRQIPFRELNRFKTRTVELWGLLNTHETVKNFMWWRTVFAKAKTWAATQEVIRRVDPRDAIVEEPWFRIKSDLQVEVARM